MLTPANTTGADHTEEKSRKSVRKKNYIPYNTVYKSQDEVRKQGYWIPGVPVHAKIINVEKDTPSGHHIFNPFLYTIELTHGKFSWTVKRRYKDFSYLSQRLVAHRAAERLKAPVRRARSKVEDAMDGDDEVVEDLNRAYEMQILSKVKEMSDFGLTKLETSPENGLKSPPSEKSDAPVTLTHVSLPNFPMVPDAVIGEAHMNERKERLEKWLQCVLNIPINRDYHETAEFLEVSRYSFINELGGKYKEGEVKKRPGGSKVYIGVKNFCVKFVLPWGHRWLVVKDSYCCYMNPHTEHIRLVLLFDEQFEIDAMDLDITIKPRIMVLSNLQHVLATKCDSEVDARLWKQIIRGVLDTTGQVWLHKKRFGSSYPVRQESHVQYFVDAKDYWEKAAAMLEIAREEIFIADWWLCPEIYMKRPMAEGNYWRLGDILRRQAERGVRIFILLYKEMEMALTLNSTYSKKYLQTLHPNIRVMRHPDHYFGTGTFFWAHHEKLIIIDQLIAFVGGLDLCYGRWDSQSHVLTDLGSVKFAPRSEGIVMRQNIVEAVQDAASVSSRQSASIDDEIHETDKPAEIHELKEDIIDEATGKKIGVRTTRTIKSADADLDKSPARPRARITKSADQDPITETPHRGRLRNLASKALRLSRAQRSSSRSRSPTPFDNGNPSHKTPMQQLRPELIFDPHHRQRSLVNQTFPFGPRSIRFRNYDTGHMDSNASPARTPDPEDASKRMDKSLQGAKNPNFSTPAASSNDQKTQPIAMEPHKSTLMRRVISNLKTNKSKKRWQLVLEKQDDPSEEYVINYCKVQETEVDVSNLSGAGKLWPGKDYVNYMVKDFVDVHDAYSDFINRYEVPRTPWHDIHSLVYGDAARDVARHFIQRWNATKTEKLKNDSNYPYLVPKSYDSVKVPRVFINQNTHKASVQVLRSVSHWSTLIDKTEDSIQQAYLSLIANAKHYIYIENQFFISMIGSGEVVNEISRVICDRILQAHRDKEVFRVYILVPLLPGFEGKINASDYSALLAVLHWTLLSIGQGPLSLLENLKKGGIEDPSKYIVFCSLRQYDTLKDQLVTEQIYIHSKLLIIDDKYTIIGSANINDRSQCGNRDSEVCLLIEDQEFVPSKMNGQPYNAGKFASSLRKQLMGEHLGLLDDTLHKNELDKPISLDDPIADSFYLDVWLKAADENTQIFEEVFRCYPTNLVSNYEELQAWQVEVPMTQYNEELARSHLKRLVGTLVRFPDQFLLLENLSPTTLSKEGILPSQIFT